MLDSYAIHQQLGDAGWRETLLSLGIPDVFLKNKHGPCPMCDGKDRFRFDNKGQGKWICNRCGAGDGFGLVMAFRSIEYREARIAIINAARLNGSDYRAEQRYEPREFVTEPIKTSDPTIRVLSLLRESCPVADCRPAVDYLMSRYLWPLPESTTLRAHMNVAYWDNDKRESLGLYPCLISPVRDINDELVTLHLTYLTTAGQKLPVENCRKIISRLTGHEGCSVRLMEPNKVMGIAEGVETALSASIMNNGIPVWASLNTSLLSKFEPPSMVDELIIFADRDLPGIEAATKLMEKLSASDKYNVRVRLPKLSDWNDDLKRKRAKPFFFAP